MHTTIAGQEQTLRASTSSSQDNNNTIATASNNTNKNNIRQRTFQESSPPPPPVQTGAMKFRAVLHDAQCMREFQHIILTLSKLSKDCVMSITRDKVHFIANEEFGTPAPLVWVEIYADLYFPEYVMAGADAQNPQIMLSVSAAKLGHALSALRYNPRSCKLKLTKIQFPCLTVQADVISSTSEQSRQIVHDVPVTVIPRSDWPHYAVPQVPSTKLVLTVPSNRLMRGLIDKIKNLSPTIVFHATSLGELNLVAETEMATITTYYKNLELRSLMARDKDNNGSTIEAACSVDCKKAALFFGALQVPTLELSCGIQDDHLIHMEVNVREGIAIHSILPAVCI